MADTNILAGGANKMTAMIAGAVLALLGLLGFVNDPVLGIFEVNAAHNSIHLLSGIVLLAVAFVSGGAYARMTLLVLGVVYALVAVGGFLVPESMETVLGASTSGALLPDNILHLLLAIGFIAVPLVVKEETRRPMTGSPRV